MENRRPHADHRGRDQQGVKLRDIEIKTSPTSVNAIPTGSE